MNLPPFERNPSSGTSELLHEKGYIRFADISIKYGYLTQTDDENGGGSVTLVLNG